MIRDRRNEDLDRLVDALLQLDGHVDVLAGRWPRDWLQETGKEWRTVGNDDALSHLCAKSAR